MIVAKVGEEQSLEYLSGKMKIERDIWEEFDFDVGEYLIFVEVDWIGESYPVVISKKISVFYLYRFLWRK
jgi:hypothetical protein